MHHKNRYGAPIDVTRGHYRPQKATIWHILHNYLLNTQYFIYFNYSNA